MSKMYRFINQNSIEEYKKPYVYVDGMQISYPSRKVLLMAGIKPLTIENAPEYNEETQFIKHYYIDGETEIIKKWNVYDIPSDEVIDNETADA